MYSNGLESDRLLFRNLITEDIKVWTDFFINNSNLPYLGLELEVLPEENSRKWIERQFWRYENNKFGLCALINKNTLKFIGQCGLLTQEVEGREEIEIGYHILPEYWHNGFATEAAKFFRDYAFNNNISNSLISIIDIRNIGSRKVAEKVGMKKEKQIEMYGLQVNIFRIKK